MTKYGRSPWLDRFPRARVRVYPRYKGITDTDVVIIGGGLTGCATAYALAAAGVKVSLLESGQLGRGGTAASIGWISGDPAVPFASAAPLLGLRAARQAWQAWHRAALDFGALIRRLGLKCDYQAHDALLVAARPEQAVRLKRERKARLEAGLDSPFLSGRVVAGELGLPAAAAIRERDGATVDPYRTAVGLAAAAEARGARLFERSPVTKISFTRRAVDIHTADGRLHASRVIAATGVPNALFKSLARHFWFKTSFTALTEPIASRLRRQLGKRTSVFHDSAAPPHVVRWVDAERLLVAGADADALPARLREKTIVQRTGQLMYELSTMYPDISGVLPAHGWEIPYVSTADGLPFIGPHRNYPHHLFAFGGAPHSVTGAYLASRILLRYHLEETDKADEAFGFARELKRESRP